MNPCNGAFYPEEEIFPLVHVIHAFRLHEASD